VEVEVVSIADVAQRARVSQTTVSHTLSGKRPVSPEVQERVRLAMAELGYTPRRAAQNLAQGRTRLLGLIVPDISNSFFAALARGIEEVAIHAQYNVVLCNSGFDNQREVLYLETIRSRAVDGAVYAAGAPPSDSELGRLLGDLPLVLVDEDVPGSAAPTFVSDNAEGGRLAAAHLLGFGHRSVAIISAGALQSAQLRTAGFTEECRRAGLAAPAVLDGGFTFEGGLVAVETILDRLVSGEITAIFAANDLMALGAIERLERAGLSVPGDVSVVGFDDVDLARFARPRLTTVRQDVSRLGQRAAATLIDALEGRRPLVPGRHVFDVQLIERDSSGPRSDMR
jgi:DNA-binding LacI/PurR family transcriptional regulator